MYHSFWNIALLTINALPTKQNLFSIVHTFCVIIIRLNCIAVKRCQYAEMGTVNILHLSLKPAYTHVW